MERGVGKAEGGFYGSKVYLVFSVSPRRKGKEFLACVG